MRIAEVTPFYHPQRGGVETVVKEYSEQLVKRGHEVHVYTTDGGWRSPWVEDVNGVKVHRSIKVPLPVLKPLSPAFLFPFKLLRTDVDLIHVHANKYFSTDMGALVAKLKNTPLAYSPHAGTFGRSLFGRIHNQTVGRLALSADVVICVSEHEKSLIEASGVGVKRLEVLPNGVDVKRYESHFKFDRRPLSQHEEHPTVLYVGRLSSHKGIDTLITAAPLVLEKIPEAKFVAAGPDGGALASSKLKVKSENLEERFTFAGEVSEEEKISLMQKADVFVLPSRSEAFGITVVEAMAAGCPVVVSDIPALTEIVSDGQTGLVFPVDDEKSLADKIIRLLSDQNLNQKLSKNAKEKVQERYNWQKIIGRLERIYQRIL